MRKGIEFLACYIFILKKYNYVMYVMFIGHCFNGNKHKGAW